jgi:hypothetical protein
MIFSRPKTGKHRIKLVMEEPGQICNHGSVTVIAVSAVARTFADNSSLLLTRALGPRVSEAHLGEVG